MEPSTKDLRDPVPSTSSELKPANNVVTTAELGSEYSEEIWDHLVEQDAKRTRVGLRSPQLKYRGSLVLLLRRMVKRMNYSLETLHSAVELLDRVMDNYGLDSDKMIQVVVACLSLAVKSDDGSRPTSVKIFSKICGTPLNAAMLRRIEFMICEHVKWKLQLPTPLTFAFHLVSHLVMDSDLKTTNRELIKQFKKKAEELLRDYLDLTLSDLNIKKSFNYVDVGCACVACARSDLGFVGWPDALVTVSKRELEVVTPVVQHLKEIMQKSKAKEASTQTEEDQGYMSGQPTPNQTPDTSPSPTPSPKPEVVINLTVSPPRVSDRSVVESKQDSKESVECSSSTDGKTERFSHRVLVNTYDVKSSTSRAVKRSLRYDLHIEVDVKRCDN